MNHRNFNVTRRAGWALLAAPLAGLGWAQAAPVSVPPALPLQSLSGLQDRVRLVKLPQEVVLVRDAVGSHQQHAAVFKELFRFAAQRYPGTHAPFGTYPDDPDAVGADQARWSLGLVLREGGNTQGLSAPEDSFRLEVSPAREALTIDSTFAEARKDGLLLYAWLPLAGYVQVAPTRVDYLDPSAAPTARLRISVPVRKRVMPDSLSTQP